MPVDLCIYCYQFLFKYVSAICTSEIINSTIAQQAALEPKVYTSIVQEKKYCKSLRLIDTSTSDEFGFANDDHITQEKDYLD